MAPRLAASGECVYSNLAWALGITQSGGAQCADGVLGAARPATVVNESSAGPVSGPGDLSLDAARASLRLLPVVAAGDFGPAAGTLGSPCVGYDTICVGGYDMGSDMSSASDDTIYSWSARGPGPLGVKKPDLVAVGGSEVADASYLYDHTLWRYDTGTSLAAPQVAGGAILLAGSGVTGHLAQKAILIDSARPGRATPASAMGTQTTWQPDWGWGALDLQAALAQRTNYVTGAVPAGSARFFATTPQAAGDRATLAWDLRETGFCDWSGPGCPSAGVVHSLSNLDLAERDGTTTALEQSSDSTVDNVEQVRATATAPTVYVVRAPSTIDGAAAEPFALAARTPLHELQAPEPQITASLSATRVHQGDEVMVTAQLTNPSPDLAGQNTTATLDVPQGVDITSGPAAEPLGTLATSGTSGASATATWTLRGTADGVAAIRVTATDSAYGEQVRAAQSAGTLTVDSTPPAVSITAPTGPIQTDHADITWQGADATSGIDHYDVESSSDAADWTPWLEPTRQTAASWQGALGHSYRWRVRAIDGVGNASAWVVTDALAMTGTSNPDDVTYSLGGQPPSTFTTTSWRPSPSTARGTTNTTTRRNPHLRLVRIHRHGRWLEVRGALMPARRVVGTLRVGGRVVRTTVQTRHGAFVARFKLVGIAGRRRATVTLSFRGDARYAPATARRVTTT